MFYNIEQLYQTNVDKSTEFAIFCATYDKKIALSMHKIQIGRLPLLSVLCLSGNIFCLSAWTEQIPKTVSFYYRLVTMKFVP